MIYPYKLFYWYLLIAKQRQQDEWSGLYKWHWPACAIKAFWKWRERLLWLPGCLWPLQNWEADQKTWFQVYWQVSSGQWWVLFCPCNKPFREIILANNYPMWRNNCTLLVCDRNYSLLNNDAKYLWVDGTVMILGKLQNV